MLHKIIIIILLITLLISGYIIYTYQRGEDMLRNTIVQMNQELGKKSVPITDEDTYVDNFNNFYIELPYGWQVIPQNGYISDLKQPKTATSYTLQYRHASNEANMELHYYPREFLMMNDPDRINTKLFTPQQIQVDREYDFAKKQYPQEQIVPEYVEDVSIHNIEAVFQTCDQVKHIYGHYICVAKGDEFIQQLFISDLKDGYFRLVLTGKHTDYGYQVDLRDWIDRINTTQN